MKKYDSLSEYRKTLSDPKAPFKSWVEGKLIEAIWSHAPCVYFEAAALMLVEGRYAGHTDTYRSDRGFTLITSDAEIKIDCGLRLYLEPTWLERHPKDLQLKALLAEAKNRMEASDVALAEYALLPGKDYWAKIVRKELWLPPNGPETPSRRAHGTALYLSDKPFVDGHPQGEASSLTNWTY